MTTAIYQLTEPQLKWVLTLALKRTDEFSQSTGKMESRERAISHALDEIKHIDQYRNNTKNNSQFFELAEVTP